MSEAKESTFIIKFKFKHKIGQTEHKIAHTEYIDGKYKKNALKDALSKKITLLSLKSNASKMWTEETIGDIIEKAHSVSVSIHKRKYQ